MGNDLEEQNQLKTGKNDISINLAINVPCPAGNLDLFLRSFEKES
jgi:hypothetical protein